MNYEKLAERLIGQTSGEPYSVKVRIIATAIREAVEGERKQRPKQEMKIELAPLTGQDIAIIRAFSGEK